jgi:hypothetical protein
MGRGVFMEVLTDVLMVKIGEHTGPDMTLINDIFHDFNVT